MRKKRRTAEANNDEETNEGSDPVFQQQENNAKRVKLSPLSETTLQDLPIQLLECILVKAVVMEVKGMKLAKKVWKEKAALVINRLKNVSLHWNNILTNNEFPTEVHRILDDTAQETIRLEILHQSWSHCLVERVTTMKEEIFMICRQPDQINVNVYDRNNMTEVKDVVALPELPTDIEGCNFSNCVYVLYSDRKTIFSSVIRITKDDEHQYHTSPWIGRELRPSFSTFLSASPFNGNLSVPHGFNPVTVNIYDANGSLMLSADIHGFRFIDRVIHKSNGNLVLASINGDHYKRVLTEIDTNGTVQRQYESSLGTGTSVHVADMYGRIVITNPLSGIELLDAELNLLDFDRAQLGQVMNLHGLHYNSERNEIMSSCVVGFRTSFLTTFRFTEE